MSRFTHIPQPTALPGSCLTCGKPTDEHGFVDTGVTIEDWGAVQVCYRCVQHMAAVFQLDAKAEHYISHEVLANASHLIDVVQMLKETNEKQLDSLLNHVSGIDRSLVQSHKLLVRAAEARERIIEEAANRASESLGLNELGDDSDELGVSAGNGGSSKGS